MKYYNIKFGDIIILVYILTRIYVDVTIIKIILYLTKHYIKNKEITRLEPVKAYYII